MVFAFGINLPVVELMVIVIILFIAGLVFMIWQIMKMNSHIKVLEQTTFEIKHYEEAESKEVQRFEMDVKNLESDEAELFLAKTVPTITKLQNFVAAELLKGKQPKKIVDQLSLKGIRKDLGSRVVDGMVYYLNFYNRLPQKAHANHLKNVAAIKIAPPKGVNMPAPGAKPGELPKKPKPKLAPGMPG